MSIINLKQYQQLITDSANQFSIGPSVIFGIVWEETKGNTWNPRFEETYYEGKKFYVPSLTAHKLGISLVTEQVMQSMSWGLMQILGVVARESGYLGPLPQLCDPAIGLYWGCNYFDRLLVRHKSMDDAISSYNQGSPRKDSNGKYLNQAYVDRVKENISEAKRIFNGQ